MPFSLNDILVNVKISAFWAQRQKWVKIRKIVTFSLPPKEFLKQIFIPGKIYRGGLSLEHDFHIEQKMNKSLKVPPLPPKWCLVKQVVFLVLRVVGMVLANRDIASSGLRVPFTGGCDKCLPCSAQRKRLAQRSLVCPTRAVSLNWKASSEAHSLWLAYLVSPLNHGNSLWLGGVWFLYRNIMGLG